MKGVGGGQENRNVGMDLTLDRDRLCLHRQREEGSLPGVRASQTPGKDCEPNRFTEQQRTRRDHSRLPQTWTGRIFPTKPLRFSPMGEVRSWGKELQEKIKENEVGKALKE